MQFAKTKGPPQITFLMMLVAIGLGSTIGVVPAVMTDRFARLNHGYTDEAECSSFTTIGEKPEACFLGSDDAQTAAANCHLVSNVLTFLTSSLIGSLSDEHGRKGILILGILLSTFSPLMLFLMQLIPSMSPWWYYGVGASTGLVNWIAVALSALNDVLPPRFRAPGIGLLLAGFMLGFSLSPILVLLFTRIQLSLVSYLVVTSALVSTIFFVPETLPPHAAEEAKRRREYESETEDDDDGSNAGYHLVSNFLKPVGRFLFRPLKEMSILNRSSFFRLISLLAFFSGMVSSGDQVLLVYYVEERIGFTEKDVTVMFLIMGLMGLLAQAVLLKPLNDRVGEKMTVAICFLIGAVDNTMYGIATKKSTIYAAVALSSLTGMAFPTISAIKSNNVDVSEQGRIQGALYSLQALASGIGPVLLRIVYRRAKDSIFGPGAMFIFAGGLYLVAVAVACALPKDKANSRREDDDDDDYEDLIDSDDCMESSGTETETSYGSVSP